MSSKEKIKKRKSKGKRHYHVLFIFFLVIIGVFFLYKEFSKESIKPVKILKPALPEKKQEVLPKVAIVIDDLGPSKKAALEVLSINASFTLSILPHETHTRWIADEGNKRGHDIIGHIPMEAKGSFTLGKGGLYTWMTDSEIRETFEGDINSIPHIKGVSNHMGSAFTEDKRAMSVPISILKERNLFFLDSLTSPISVGLKLTEEKGLKALKRDVFLDDKDTFDYISAQWERALNIARKQGHVIVLAHPRENTIKFLKETLPKNEVKIVPISELL